MIRKNLNSKFILETNSIKNYDDASNGEKIALKLNHGVELNNGDNSPFMMQTIDIQPIIVTWLRECCPRLEKMAQYCPDEMVAYYLFEDDEAEIAEGFEDFQNCALIILNANKIIK